MTDLAALACPDPAQRPDLWPWSAAREDGALWVGGVSLIDVAKEYATPAYVWDEADFEGRCQVWAAAMAEAFWEGYGFSGAKVNYAGKAFLCADAVRAATRAGLGIDTASLGELSLALAAGAPASEIGLHGNNKGDRELELAIAAGIDRIIVDSLPEVAQVERIAAAAGKQARVMVRLTTGVHAGGHEYISTAHEDQKFGLSIATGQAEEVIDAIAQCDHLELVGLHSHIGSQILDLDAFAASASKVMAFRAKILEKGLAVGEVDLGGGYAIAYTGADPQAPTANEISLALAEAVKDACQKAGTDIPVISIEPGRSIAGPSQVMLYSVGTIKDVTIAQGQTRRYVSVDGGISDNIRPALYGANYSATLANRISEAETVLCRVVGKHCESGDVVVNDVALPADLQAGDLLAVPAVGAYGRAMASNYNMLARPGVVGVRNGKWREIIKRETIEDLLAADKTLEK